MERNSSISYECLLRILMPFNGINPRSAVVMDNATIHHIETVVDLIENQSHAKLIFLPPLLSRPKSH